MSISVSQVTRKFGTQKALNEVSFEIASGEVVGFLGPNGAGKSTMMKIITGYLPQTSGKVMVCGLDVTDNTMEYRRKIGYLPEHNPLYLDMYVKEYLGHIASLYKLGRKSKKRVEEMIEMTGLTPESTKKISALSKGYRQRVGLAQALLPDPEVLILDEPTTGLDPNQIIEVRDLIKEVGKQKTVMLSTHIMQEVQAICENVIIINKGNIVANEKASSLTGASLRNKHEITCEFLTPVKKDIFDHLEGLIEVKSLTNTKYRIIASSDIRPTIFDRAVSHGQKIITLTQDQKSMEDVFRELTSNKK
ncbi:gliding motility-associated ABC transporter ATP-binding subunit GldA [Saccharicrinis fermentans]|uniref:Putative ABC transporter ATP-binding protein YbhF n=1 Tax=Saccharicrinis fermentans DSM 9555 = JCM 21142 TaxID=869213 RepID=W7YB40_9BACT|nr:gliding motility-associated ABC transporter ATP-binding subunit GldA [Saccharicrinis fermentans]GAF01576.1 putative ABC transporter ATP-binding protein YbhF [Saccharicrinis fermentans DSM 9555 = JCM 21142]